MSNFNSEYLNDINVLAQEGNKDTSEEEMEVKITKNSFTRPKTTARLENLPTPQNPPIMMSNKFGLLEKTGQIPPLNKANNNIGKILVKDKINNPQQPKLNTTKKQFAPSIVVNQWVANYKILITKIREILGHDDLTRKFTKFQVKVLTKCYKDHDKLINDFREAYTNFHTFFIPNMDTDVITEYMKEENIEIKKCVALKGRHDVPYCYLIIY